MTELTRLTAPPRSPDRRSPPARSRPSRSPRRTSTGSPPSTARCTPSCTSTPTARWRRRKAVDAQRAAGEQLGPLAGVPLAMKDVVVTKGLPTTAGSKILEGWRPPYDATITQRIKDAGIVMLGKTNMDEFAMGSSTENSAYGPTHNPWDLVAHPGRLVRRFECCGRGVRGPARDRHRHRRLDPPARRRHRHRRAQADLRRGVALRPHRVLVLARPGRPVRAHRARHRVAARGHRRARSVRLHLDPRSRSPPVVAAAREGAARRSRRACASASCASSVARATSPACSRRSRAAVETLRGLGAEVVEVSCPHFDYALAAYYLIAPSECSSNLARFDGVRYGLARR